MCVDYDQQTGNLVSGGNDKTVVVFDRNNGEIVTSCKGKKSFICEQFLNSLKQSN